MWIIAESHFNVDKRKIDPISDSSTLVIFYDIYITIYHKCLIFYWKINKLIFYHISVCKISVFTKIYAFKDIWDSYSNRFFVFFFVPCSQLTEFPSTSQWYQSLYAFFIWRHITQKDRKRFTQLCSYLAAWEGETKDSLRRSCQNTNSADRLCLHIKGYQWLMCMIWGKLFNNSVVSFPHQQIMMVNWWLRLHSNAY